MPVISDNAFDAALSYVRSNGTRLDICSQEPGTYAQATSTYTLGNATDITIGAPANGDSSGRKVTIAAIYDGDVTGSDDATHWAVTDGSSELLAVGALTETKTVVSGSNFTVEAIDVTIADPS